jgi:predicted HTH domain antitoxin
MVVGPPIAAGPHAYNEAMTLTIPDDILQRAGLTEREVLIELACRLFDAERIGKGEATTLCRLSRVEFEAELIKRNLDVYHMTDEDWDIEQQARKAG